MHTYKHTRNAVCRPSGGMSNPLIQCQLGQGPQHRQACRLAFWESERNKYESRGIRKQLNNHRVPLLRAQ